MPLPENWNGVFWSRQTNGDLLLDVDPDRLMAFLDEYPDDEVFLIGGACFDLHLNGMEERANLLLEAAERRWPKVPWRKGYGQLCVSMVSVYRLASRSGQVPSGPFYTKMEQAARAYRRLAES